MERYGDLHWMRKTFERLPNFRVELFGLYRVDLIGSAWFVADEQTAIAACVIRPIDSNETLRQSYPAGTDDHSAPQ